MSNQSFPGGGGGRPKPGSQQDFQNLPGMQNVRPAPAEAQFALMRAMGQGYKKLGEELMKGPQMDPTEAARGKAMIKQAQQAAQGSGAPQPQQAQPTGGPRPVDRGIDPLSGAPVGGQGQGRNTQGF